MLGSPIVQRRVWSVTEKLLRNNKIKLIITKFSCKENSMELGEAFQQIFNTTQCYNFTIVVYTNSWCKCKKNSKNISIHLWLFTTAADISCFIFVVVVVVVNSIFRIFFRSFVANVVESPANFLWIQLNDPGYFYSLSLCSQTKCRKRRI